MTGRRDSANPVTWFRYAKEDLECSVELLARVRSGGSRVVPRHICWLAQQAVEKAMKAGMIASGQQVERSHDLNDLRDRLADNWGVKGRAERLGWLSTWEVDGRYPGEGLLEPSLNDASEAVRLALIALDAIEDDLRTRGIR